MLLAGVRRHYNTETRRRIPNLWHEVGPQFGKIPSQVGNIGYGVCLATSDRNEEFDYMAAAEVSDVKNLPAGWTSLRLSAQRYAVFPHEGHVSKINETVADIFQNWLPSSGQRQPSARRDQPDFLEHYGEGYDPSSGAGDIEIWVPVIE